MEEVTFQTYYQREQWWKVLRYQRFSFVATLHHIQFIHFRWATSFLNHKWINLFRNFIFSNLSPCCLATISSIPLYPAASARRISSCFWLYCCLCSSREHRVAVVFLRSLLFLLFLGYSDICCCSAASFLFFFFLFIGKSVHPFSFICLSANSSRF